MSWNVATGPNSAGACSLGEAPSPVLAIALGVLAVVWLAVLLSLGGAWDTDELSLPRSLMVWTIISGLLVSQPVVIDRQLARLTALPVSIGGALAVLATVALMTVEIALLKKTPLPPSGWGQDSLFELAEFIWPQTVLVAAGVIWLRRVFLRPARRPLTRGPSLTFVAQRRLPSPPIAGLLQAPEWATLAEWPGAQVSRVQAHDHYLEVHTDDGRVTLVRGRMRDAALRLAGADGLRVHRSWWVSRRSIAQIGRFGRDYLLVMTDGTAAPVARGRLPELRRRGWIT